MHIHEWQNNAYLNQLVKDAIGYKSFCYQKLMTSRLDEPSIFMSSIVTAKSTMLKFKLLLL